MVVNRVEYYIEKSPTWHDIVSLYTNSHPEFSPADYEQIKKDLNARITSSVGSKILKTLSDEQKQSVEQHYTNSSAQNPQALIKYLSSSLLLSQTPQTLNSIVSAATEEILTKYYAALRKPL